MPIAITKYRCAFKCGKKSVENESRMKAHESHCWKNPDCKTCKTCSNEIYGLDGGDGFDRSFYRGCKLKELSTVLESSHVVMSSQNSLHVRPVYNCPYWNGNGDDKIEQFADELFEEINGKEEGTIHYPFFNKPVKGSESINPFD